LAIPALAAHTMPRPFRLLVPGILGPVFAILVIATAAPAAAQKAEAAPKPETYLCPNATGGAVDCFLHAVEHLYTMCRQVKSIEIIEFGYEKSEQGVNGAKSEYCVDKHRASIARPYQSALREATGSRAAVDGLRAIHDLWLKALAELKWKAGESDDEYKARIAKPYDEFRDRATVIRASLPAGKAKAATAAVTPATATAAKRPN
jgi:hypothetical protein